MSEHIKKQLEIMNHQAKELAAVYHGIAHQAGVSDNEFWVWYALMGLKGEYSQQDICDMWSLPKQTVNTVITNLNKKGMLSLEIVPGTRNRKIIRLSEEGKIYGDKIVMRIYRAEQAVFTKLTDEEMQSCIALLGKYITLLKDELYEK